MTHLTQLNSPRPELVSYLSALEFITDYLTKHTTTVATTVEHVVDNLSLVYMMVEYNKGYCKMLRKIVRSEMDVQLQIDAELEGLHKYHNTTVVTSHVAAHQDKQ